jgi:hypothetical protein
VGGAPRVSQVMQVSRGCAGRNAEVEVATAAPAYVYALWIGCGGIGFARSADGGLRFGPAAQLPGSAGFSWDPAITVAPGGTVYAAYMHRRGTQSFPVVAASTDHGKTFPQVVPLLPPGRGNFGDRDFIAAGRSGRVYVSWDYGPSAAKVHFLCSRGGSCAFSRGDLNMVAQVSADGGKTWGPITPMGPGFPRNGGFGAPLAVQPDGRVAALYLGHYISPGSYLVHPGHEYFTSSPDGRRWPRHPLELWPGQGPVALSEWWIDTDLAADSAGDLYACWDTQTRAGDIGWLSASTDGGKTWRPPVRVTPDHTRAPHIMAVVGGGRGIAYAGWQTDASPAGYATYVRPYSLTKGWLGPAVKVSPRYGNPRIWPGDTFGIATVPGSSPVRLALSWGSAVGHQQDPEIYAAVVTVP